MNDERGFVDLDKAVRKQQMKRAATVAKKGGKARGLYMDMVRPVRSDVRPPTRNYSVGKTIAAPAPRVENAPKSAKKTMGMVVAPSRKPEVAQPKKPVENKKNERPDLFTAEPEDEKSPDANNYSLGGRSPFLTDAKVDKRPLGPNVPESNAGAIRSTKNVYSQRTPLKSEEDVVPGRGVITVAAPKKKSGWLWALVTLGIIAAGGGIGFLAYTIFVK